MAVKICRSRPFIEETEYAISSAGFFKVGFTNRILSRVWFRVGRGSKTEVVSGLRSLP
jgi:hypothetical protein